VTDALERGIAARAAAYGIGLGPEATAALATHARAVLASAERLNLTTVTDPEELLRRHVGESLAGAVALEPGIRGRLVDLGSGNGYPGIPLAVARPGLTATLVEASARKAEFLRDTVRAARLAAVEVFHGQVQRPADLPEADPIMVLASRAMGGWERVVPRFAAALAPEGRVLLWAGEDTDRVLRRTAWRRLQLVDRLPLPDRERSWVFVLRRA